MPPLETRRHTSMINPPATFERLSFSERQMATPAVPMAAIARGVKERGKNVFAFTGFTYEELVKKAQSGDGTQELLDLCDMIVDGRFVLAERDLSLRFRGSRNQRILDMQKTREAGVPVLAEEYM